MRPAAPVTPPGLLLQELRRGGIPVFCCAPPAPPRPAPPRPAPPRPAPPRPAPPRPTALACQRHQHQGGLQPLAVAHAHPPQVCLQVSVHLEGRPAGEEGSLDEGNWRGEHSGCRHCHELSLYLQAGHARLRQPEIAAETCGYRGQRLAPQADSGAQPACRPPAALESGTQDHAPMGPHRHRPLKELGRRSGLARDGQHPGHLGARRAHKRLQPGGAGGAPRGAEGWQCGWQGGEAPLPLPPTASCRSAHCQQVSLPPAMAGLRCSPGCRRNARTASQPTCCEVARYMAKPSTATSA